MDGRDAIPEREPLEREPLEPEGDARRHGRYDSVDELKRAEVRRLESMERERAAGKVPPPVIVRRGGEDDDA